MAYCVHDELPGDCRICSETGDMMPGDTPAEELPRPASAPDYVTNWLRANDFAVVSRRAYEDLRRSTPAEGLERAVIDAARKVHDSQQSSSR